MTILRQAPLPNQYVNTGSFWKSACERRLVIQSCGDTGRLQHYPRPVSLATGSRNLNWREVSGAGEIYTWTVIRIPVAGFENQGHFIVAMVQLDEGVRVQARILDDALCRIEIGARVELDWDTFDDGVLYPAFRLV